MATQSQQDLWYGNSKCRIVVSTHPRREGEQPKTYFSEVGSQQEVISGSIQKNTANPCGSFSLELVPFSQDWLKIIRPDDWVDIYLTTGVDGREEHVMTGLVDTVRRNRSVIDANGATQTTIVVSGRDVAKCLLEIEPFFDPFLDKQVLGQATVFLNDNSAEIFRDNIARTPSNFLNVVLKAYLAPINLATAASKTLIASKQFRHPDGRFLYHPDPSLSVFQTDFKDDIFSPIDGRLIKQAFIAGGPPILENSLWQFMDTYANRGINALYLEMAPTSSGTMKPTFFLHPYPFSSDAFNALTTYTVYRNETPDENIGLNSHDTKNWFRVECTLNTGDETMLAATTRTGYFNPTSIIKHGIRRMTIETMYANIFKNETSAQIEYLKELSALLAEWHWNNDEMLEGSITTRLRPDIRLNSRINYITENEETSYYVEGYSHSFGYPGRSTTSLKLTRGLPTVGRQATFKQLMAQGILKDMHEAASVDYAIKLSNIV